MSAVGMSGGGAATDDGGIGPDGSAEASAGVGEGGSENPMGPMAQQAAVCQMLKPARTTTRAIDRIGALLAILVLRWRTLLIIVRGYAELKIGITGKFRAEHEVAIPPSELSSIRLTPKPARRLRRQFPT
jgi:hypothetical protein